MPVDWDRHNAVFQRHLGETVTYTHVTGGPEFEVTAVPANLLQAFPDGTQAAMDAVWVRRSDFDQAPANGDTVVRGEKTYRVVSVRDDRAGGVYLALN